MWPLEVDELSFSYNERNPIFKSIKFHVEPGEVFCIIGPNGCGKTTLIDSILGLNAPQSGMIKAFGKNLSKMKAAEFAAHIAYVPQNHVKTFPYSVLDIVLMGRTAQSGLFSSPSASEKDKACQALNMVGMSDFKNCPYTQLSGGELQLVLIARAIAQESKILILDEPTAHLDFRHELMVLELIDKISKQQRLSIIMTTHFLNQPFFLGNANTKTRVALMHQGTFKSVGHPNAVITKENLEKYFNIQASIGETYESGQLRQFIVPLKTSGANHEIK
ncbi:ABC transporter ATP-binding protein [Eubacteriaceae bacterium ES3]|nr:ABC transporter ATP-binding protein [Eubacteriaceae bacterium ES3]